MKLSDPKVCTFSAKWDNNNSKQTFGKCLFYSLEQPPKKRIPKALCSSVISGPTPVCVWSFDPFLPRAGPCPDSFTLQTTSDGSPRGRQTKTWGIEGCCRVSQQPLSNNQFTFLFLKFSVTLPPAVSPRCSLSLGPAGPSSAENCPQSYYHFVTLLDNLALWLIQNPSWPCLGGCHLTRALTLQDVLLQKDSFLPEKFPYQLLTDFLASACRCTVKLSPGSLFC